MEPLVSVICITRNHERFCIESLNSVFNQTYKNIELVILDAASSDGTVDLIEKWILKSKLQVIFIKLKELKPITINVNSALKYTSGDFIQLLSLDDLLLENKIETQLASFFNDRELGVIFGDAMKIDDKGNLMGSIFGFKSNKYETMNNFDFLQLLSLGNNICGPTALIRKEIYHECGTYDENLIVEDWDFWLRVSKSNWKIRYSNKFFAKYRVSENSLWHSGKAEVLISMIKTMKKHGFQDQLSTTVNIFYDFRKMKTWEKTKTFYYLISIKEFKILIPYVYSIFSENKEMARRIYKRTYRLALYFN